jgi:hypothetical protein
MSDDATLVAFARAIAREDEAVASELLRPPTRHGSRAS